jgi:prepilin-type N-terminal cleavage/methylation domain-containing protein
MNYNLRDLNESKGVYMNSRGFTLLELSIVIIIMGLFMIPAFRMYDTYLYDKRHRETRENLAKIQTEISIYQIKHGRYPCPADRSLPSTDPNYGLEKCTEIQSLTIGTCGGQNDPTGMCRVTGAGRDVSPADGTDDPVLVGGIPFATLADIGSLQPRQISIQSTLDGWNHKITYAVTESLSADAKADPQVFNNQNGVIKIMDEAGNDTGGTEDNAHYVLISHGKDGRGGFSREGQQISLCASGIFGVPGGLPSQAPSIPDGAAMSDTQNCDLNGSFVQALDNSDADNDKHYDDLMVFGLATSTTLWDYIVAGGATTNEIKNLNTGFVGVKTAGDPSEELDVGGAIRAETRVRTDSICDDAGQNCFKTEYLAGNLAAPANLANEGNNATPGIKCFAGRAMTGISKGDEQCSDVALPATFTPQTCPVVSGKQTWLRGITTDGIILCTP